MSTPSSPNTTMSDDSIDFTVLERPDKPFKCSERNWAFKYNKHLLHHRRVQHGMDNRALYHQAKAEAQTKWIPYNSNLEKIKMRIRHVHIVVAFLLAKQKETRMNKYIGKKKL